jgi:PTS system nitrogen regulatory IIA component
VRFLIMLLVPKNQAQVHLQTLAAIAGLFSRREVRERLAAARTGEELYAILGDCEADAG